MAKVVWESNPENHRWFNRRIKISFEHRKAIQICGDIYKPTVIYNDENLSLNSDCM